VPVVDGLSDDHCRGYWWTLDDIQQFSISYFLILERLQWLAPAQVSVSCVMGKDMLHDALHRHFERDNSPVMLAIMQKNGDVMQEVCRGMVVPDGWLLRAREKRQEHLPRQAIS
jgi:uncharacterized protein